MNRRQTLALVMEAAREIWKTLKRMSNLKVKSNPHVQELNQRFWKSSDRLSLPPQFLVHNVVTPISKGSVLRTS